MRFISKTVAFAAAAGLVFCGYYPAQADDFKHTKSEVAKSVDKISPDLLVDTLAPSEDVTTVDQSSNETVVTVEASSDFKELPMTLGDGSEAVKKVAGDLVVEGDDLKTLVNPTDGGAQIIFKAETPNASDDLAVTFDSKIVDKAELGDGQIALDFENGTSIAVDKPWAYDAAKNPLKTSYVIEGNTLRQVVETSPSTQWPILADPNWSYTLSYGLYKKDTPTDVAKRLKATNGFKKFPVSGRPNNFPKPGQFLPLTTLTRNFNCTFHSQFSGNDGSEQWWGFRFNSTSKHIDGKGSWIKFTFVRSLYLGENKLYIVASIANDRPAGMSHSLYVKGARTMWNQFATNIKSNESIAYKGR